MTGGLPSYSSFRSYEESPARWCLEALRAFGRGHIEQHGETQEHAEQHIEKRSPERDTTRERGYDRNDGNDQSPAKPSPAAIVAALVGDFARHGATHEIRFPGVPETLFLVPTPSEGERFAAQEGISRGRIWTAQELADLLAAAPGVRPADFAAVALAKLVFDGEVVEVRPRRSR